MSANEPLNEPNEPPSYPPSYPPNEPPNDNDVSSLKSNDDDQPKRRNQWTQHDMDVALDSLKNREMSMQKASIVYGVPYTTLRKYAHKKGVVSPAKSRPIRFYSKEDLNNALEAIREGTMSAYKASRLYHIPQSTLYKIAMRKGLPVASRIIWSFEYIEESLEEIRSCRLSVPEASAKFGISKKMIYSLCKKNNIALRCKGSSRKQKESRKERINLALCALKNGTMSASEASDTYDLSYSTVWHHARRMDIDLPRNKCYSEEAVNQALKEIAAGETSVNMAAKNYGIPPSSLYFIAKKKGIELPLRSNASSVGEFLS